MSDYVKLGLSPDKTIEAINDALDAQNLALEDLEEKIINLPDNDTKNTAGATDGGTDKMYLVGAKNTTANPQTYTGGVSMQNGILYSKSANVENASEQNVLTQDDYNKIIELLGELSGGMRFKGTLNGGSSSSPTILPNDSTIESGDTYKVATAGTFKYLKLPSAGSTTGGQAYTIEADVGDLLILSDGAKWWAPTWTLVPSGDDGDIYATESFPENVSDDDAEDETVDQLFDGGGHVLVTDNDGVNPKRAKAAAARILKRYVGSGSFPQSLYNDLPTVQAVIDLIGYYIYDLAIHKVSSSEFSIDTTYGDATTHLDDQNNYRLITGITDNYSKLKPIAAYDQYNQVMLVGLACDATSRGLTVIVHKDLKANFSYMLAVQEY